MAIPEFKTADQIKIEDWERVHERRFSDVLRLLDVATTQARENAVEGGGFEVEATVDGFTVKFAAHPVPRDGGYDSKSKSAPGLATFDKVKVDAVLMANQDQLQTETVNGKLTIKPKRFLGDAWNAINTSLRDAGMKWVRDEKNSRWEQS